MLRRYVKDLVVDPETLKGKNENQKFKLIYGPERLEAFKKNRTRFPEEYRDMNTWIKPFFENEYLDPEVFDEIIHNIQEEDARRREERNLRAAVPVETPEERAERLRREELAIAEGQNITPIVSSDGLEYLGADAKYRVYKATNYTGAHNFALPRSEGKGWCITGSGYWGSGPSQGPSYWRSQLTRTKDNAFYFFMTTPAKDSYCVFINNQGHLVYVLNELDNERPTLPSNVTLPLDIAGLDGKVAKTGTISKLEGPFRVQGSSLTGLTDEGMQMQDIMIRADLVSINQYAISGSRNLKVLTITSNTQSIQKYGISSNINLKEIKFQGETMHFGEGALSNNPSLLSLKFPSNSNVASKILKDCSKLQVVTLPNNLTNIEPQAFEGDKSLIVINIPTSCTNIGENAFNGCRNLVIKTDFTEKPEGWYNNIEKHVREIHYAEKPEEEPVVEVMAEETQENAQAGAQDSAIKDNQYVIKKIGKEWFFAGDKDIPDETAYIDMANKYDDLQDAEDWAEYTYGRNWKDICEIVNVEDYKNGVTINDIYPNKGEKKEDFIERFMSETKEEYPDNKQRYAVALSYWDRRKKVKDSEMVIDTNEDEDNKLEIAEDKEIKQEVLEFSIQTFLEEAIKDLKSAHDETELNSKYDQWIAKSDDLVAKGKINYEQQEQLEDNIWEAYNSILSEKEGE